MEVIRGIERALKALKEIRGVAAAGKMAMDGAKFSAFETLLKDPGAFRDPDKLAGILTEGALMGVGTGVLGKAIGKGLKALKPSELAGLARTLRLGENGLSKLGLRPGEAERLEAGIQAAEKECKLDPVDVATGDMLLPQTDVELPGILPLMVQRTHVSSYRWGGWFGPSWASTLDQRLQADDVCITYAAPDGSRLVHPLLDAAADGPVLPETGPRMPLSWDTEVVGAVRILDPRRGKPNESGTESARRAPARARGAGALLGLGGRRSRAAHGAPHGLPGARRSLRRRTPGRVPAPAGARLSQ
jgi:hypothetical protein